MLAVNETLPPVALLKLVAVPVATFAIVGVKVTALGSEPTFVLTTKYVLVTFGLIPPKV